MSVQSPNNGEVFSVRVYKRASGYTWANAYEMRVFADGLTTSDLVNAALAITTAERQFHFNFVNFYKTVVSTYVPDTRPYNPTNFTTITLSEYGLRSPLNDHMLPLTACVFVRFMTEFGRPGKRFYRGCLREGDVEGVLASHFIVQVTRNAIENALGQIVGIFAPSIELVTARGTPAPTDVRRIIAVNASELSVNRKLDNRYFDVRAR